MNRQLLLITLFIFCHLTITAQSSKPLHIGVDISPYQNIKGQHELMVQYQFKNSRFLNPYFRIGYANRKVDGSGCLIGDGVYKKRAQGYFLKFGNDILLLKEWAISPMFIFNSYKSSGVNSSTNPPEFIEIKSQKTFYGGINLRYNVYQQEKLGVSLCLYGVKALQKERFLGANCNETKIGAGVPLANLYYSFQILLFAKI